MPTSRPTSGSSAWTSKYRERLPRVITDKDGVQWRVSEGHRPDRLRLSTLEGEDLARNKAGADPLAGWPTTTSTASTSS